MRARDTKRLGHMQKSEYNDGHRKYKEESKDTRGLRNSTLHFGT